MFKVITNRNDFIFNPKLEMNEKQINNSKVDTFKLFNQTFKMYHDDWKHHIHIKCTDRCDSNCRFCIEKSEKNNPQNAENVLKSSKILLDEFKKQNMLRTVSITGGEPMMFNKINDLVKLISRYDILLLSINTNGYGLHSLNKDFTGWVNISKHAIDDGDIFRRDFVVTPEYLVDFKKSHPRAKIRLQCVLGVTKKMSYLDDICKFIDYYKDVVDDFSFRNLIIENNESKINNLLFDFRFILFKYHQFSEQVIQDYYVYENYIYHGVPICISWSNMKELKNYNESHNNNFLEEIIVHPDGTICGSWNKKSLIIYTPDKRGNEYIPCLGTNCNQKETCRRFAKNQVAIDSCHIESCGSQVAIDSCYVESC